MKHSSSKVRRILEFLGSVKMTVILLIFGAIAMGVGTVLESRVGTEAAQSSVYATAWFDIFLLLIVVNLAAAVINRLPLKRHQLAFAVTHASIILLMFGAWMSRHYGYEGQVRIYEGQGNAVLHMYEREVILSGPSPNGGEAGESHVLRRFPLPDTVYLDGFQLQQEGMGNAGVEVLEFIPDGFLTTGIEPSDQGKGPGIQYTVAGQGESVDGWLLSDHPDYRRNDLGPLEVEVLRFRSQEDLDHRIADISEGSAVYVDRGDGRPPLRIALPDGLGSEIDFGGGISVKVSAFYEYARVVNGSVANDPGGPMNPAAVVEIKSPSRTESHVVFSEFPEFSRHEEAEDGPLTAGVRLSASSASSKPLLSFLVGPGGKFFTQVSGSSGRGPVMELPMDGNVPITGTAFAFSLTRFFPDATVETRVTPAKPGQEGGRAILRLALSNGTATDEFWLQQGSKRDALVVGPGVKIEFGRQTLPLPFRVDLEEFEVSYYPGGTRPKNYSSNVRVSAIDGSTPAMASLISMNKPLDYMGFRIFQSSYVLGGGGRPDMTILSVSYDPGVPIVYAAFILLILGVGWYVLGDGRAHNHKNKSNRKGDKVGYSVTFSPEPTEERSTQHSKEIEKIR